MAKKIFIISMITGTILLYGLIVCSYLLAQNINVGTIDLQLVGRVFAYGIVPVGIISPIAGFYHLWTKHPCEPAL